MAGRTGRMAIGIWLAVAAMAGAGMPATAQNPADAAILKRHKQFPGCEEGRPVETTAKLGEDKTLYVIVCEVFAYNATFALYVASKGDAANAERLSFAEPSKELGWSGTTTLYNVTFDAAARTLKALYKGRGVGDCGTAGVWRWTAAGFKLIEYRAKPGCNGKAGVWPVIYRDGAR